MAAYYHKQGRGEKEILRLDDFLFGGKDKVFLLITIRVHPDFNL
jgi:hypothetical protein